MNKDLSEKWDEALRTRKPVLIDDLVVCDCCNEDFTTRSDQGGFILGPYAYCPACAYDLMLDKLTINELFRIKAFAREGESFRSFVLRMRGPNATVQISSL